MKTPEFWTHLPELDNSTHISHVLLIFSVERLIN